MHIKWLNLQTAASHEIFRWDFPRAEGKHSVLKGGLKVQAILTEWFFILNPLAVMKILITMSQLFVCAIHLFVKAIYFPDFGHILPK